MICSYQCIIHTIVMPQLLMRQIVFKMLNLFKKLNLCRASGFFFLNHCVINYHLFQPCFQPVLKTASQCLFIPMTYNVTVGPCSSGSFLLFHFFNKDFRFELISIICFHSSLLHDPCVTDACKH